jgi:hypothetical protein
VIADELSSVELHANGSQSVVAVSSSEAPYAALALGFVAMCTSFAVANRRSLPDRLNLSDVAGTALAAHAISRIVARARITTFVRAPFASGEAAQEPRGDGFRRAVGELLTCPHCLTPWIAAGLSSLLVLRPREARWATSVFAATVLSEAPDLVTRMANVIRKR